MTEWIVFGWAFVALLLCARTAVTSGDAHWTPEQMAVRAIELWIEGYGE